MDLVLFFHTPSSSSVLTLGMGIPFLCQKRDTGSRIGVMSWTVEGQHVGRIASKENQTVYWRFAPELDRDAATELPIHVKAADWVAGAQLVEVVDWPSDVHDSCFISSPLESQLESCRATVKIRLATKEFLYTAGAQAWCLDWELVRLLFPEARTNGPDYASFLRDLELPLGCLLPFVADDDPSLLGVFKLGDSLEDGIVQGECHFISGKGELHKDQLLVSRFFCSFGTTELEVQTPLGQLFECSVS
jgi:hypothetical protein